jgi:hypothetical protein
MKLPFKIVAKLSEKGKNYKAEISYNEELVRKMKLYCHHELRELTKEELKDEWMSVGAHCLICGVHWGWRCKKSPDYVCHYDSEEGKIQLIDGTFVKIPKNHDVESENEDWCIFCRLPLERK